MMRTTRPLFVFLGLLASLNASGSEMMLPIDVNISGKHAEINGYVDDEDEQFWALDGEELLTVLSNIVDANRLEHLRPTLQQEKVTHQEFTQLGWQVEYSPDALLIDIDVPVQDRKIMDITLESYFSSKIPDNLSQVKPSVFSGAINTYWSHTQNLTNSDFSKSQLSLRTAAALGPITLEDIHNYYFYHGINEGKWQRQSTRLMANLPNNSGFLQFGDYHLETDILSLPGGDLFGLSYSYQPTYLRRLNRPNLVPLSLEANSLVTIIINGEEYRKMRLSSGQYNLRDLPLEQGVNNVEITYTDQNGIEQRQFYNLVDHPEIMLKGDFETQWVYGANQTYSDSGQKEIEEDQMHTQGVVSYGLLDWWTLSSSFDVSDDEQNYILEHNFAIDRYFMSLDGHYRTDDDSENYDITTQFYADSLFNERLKSFSADYSLSHLSDEEHLIHKIGLSSAIEMPFEIGYLTFNLSHEFDKEETLYQTASLSGNYRFYNYVNTALNLRWQRRQDDIDRQIYFSVSIPLGWQGISLSARTSYNSNSNEYQSELSASKYSSDYYWRTSTQFIDKNYDGFEGYGKYYGDHVNWDARYSSYNHSNSDSEQKVAIGLDTAIAWAGSKLIWTTPISNSFTIVSIPDEFKDKYALHYDEYRRIEIIPEDEGGTSELLVPINNNSHRKVNVLYEALEFNEELSDDTYVALSGLYSGSHQALNINKGYFITGYFYDQFRHPLADVVGEFRNHKTKSTYPFFTDLEGNFELDGLPVGEYEVYFYDDAAQSVDITIEQAQIQQDMFVELGDLNVIIDSDTKAYRRSKALAVN